jgi:hypothetical protein
MSATEGASPSLNRKWRTLVQAEPDGMTPLTEQRTVPGIVGNGRVVMVGVCGSVRRHGVRGQQTTMCDRTERAEKPRAAASGPQRRPRAAGPFLGPLRASRRYASVSPSSGSSQPPRGFWCHALDSQESASASAHGGQVEKRKLAVASSENTFRYSRVAAPWNLWSQ